VQELGGSTARQGARLANGNIPYHKHHAQLMSGRWLGCRNLFFLISLRFNTLLSGSLNFSGSSVSLGSFAKSTISASLGFCDHCLGTDCEMVIGW